MIIAVELVVVGCLQKYIGGIDRCDDHDGKTKREIKQGVLSRQVGSLCEKWH